MLQDGFTRPKRPRNTISSAFCNWKESVDCSDFGDKRLCRHQTLCITVDNAFNWPLEAHRDRKNFPATIFKLGNLFVNRVSPSLFDKFHFVRFEHIKRNHNAMRKSSFRHSPQSVSFNHSIAYFRNWSKVPFFIAWKRVDINTSLQKVSSFFGKLWQRVLQSIVNLCQKSRPQFC